MQTGAIMLLHGKSFRSLEPNRDHRPSLQPKYFLVGCCQVCAKLVSLPVRCLPARPRPVPSPFLFVSHTPPFNETGSSSLARLQPSKSPVAPARAVNEKVRLVVCRVEGRMALPHVRACVLPWLLVPAAKTGLGSDAPGPCWINQSDPRPRGSCCQNLFTISSSTSFVVLLLTTRTI